MQPVPPCPGPARWWWTQASGLLLCWQLQLGTYSMGFFFFSSQLCCPLRFQNSHRPACEKVSYCVETSPPSWLPPQGKSLSLTLLSLFAFYILSYKEVGLPFWVPGVLRQHSEVVLLKLFSIQMTFWWIYGGESGLPVLFLHHLGTNPSFFPF